MDDFFSNIKQYGITPIDVRIPFKANKDKVQLYYRTDHHWTTDGAYVAFKKSCKVMGLKDSIIDYRSYAVKTTSRALFIPRAALPTAKMMPSRSTCRQRASQRGYKNSVIYYADTRKRRPASTSWIIWKRKTPTRCSAAATTLCTPYRLL
jgi:hypothetical protein